MPYRAHALAAVLFFTAAGCASTETTTIERSPAGGYRLVTPSAACQRTLRPSVGTVEVDGQDIPVAWVEGGKVKIGPAHAELDALYEASDAVLAMDMMQYTSCLRLAWLRSDEARKKVLEQRDAEVRALVASLLELNKAGSREEYQQAARKAQERRKALEMRVVKG
jgi:pyrimidine deaminase RibD-like protein